LNEPIKKELRLCLCQINSKVGDLKGNAEKILSFTKEALDAEADLAIFPELSLTGYPPEDLVLKKGFLLDVKSVLDDLTVKIIKPPTIFGFPELATVTSDKSDLIETRSLEKTQPIAYNALALVSNGELLATYHKQHLPNYSVFDEQRLFLKGAQSFLMPVICGITMGIIICEDAWIPNGPLQLLANNGASLSIIINASPFYAGRLKERIEFFSNTAKQLKSAIAYVNTVGGQDELVFDGGSFVINQDGDLVALASQFKEDLLVADISVTDLPNQLPKSEGKNILRPAVSIRSKPKQASKKAKIGQIYQGVQEIYQALVLATKDYVEKNGFKGALIGLSGGIDSSLVTCIAADALGAASVTGILMPSKYSSEASVKDALSLVKNLGINHIVFPISEIHEEFHRNFKKFAYELSGLADENIQSRIRGLILMAISNQTNQLVLTTGNKSELAVGYSTLYGDTAGGFAVIKDIFKTQVYQLAKFKNEHSGYEVIPLNVFSKPPSAELRENQTDQDSLPPYDLLDQILFYYIEKDFAASEISDLGLDKDVISRVLSMVDSSEYKRRQTPLGPRITPRSFGKDRRMPITNFYKVGKSQKI